MGTAIQTSGLTKVYALPGRRGSHAVVDGLTLEVPEGQVFAFLGPNGAGKTTTIKMLLGFIRPTRGSAELFGRDVSQPEARQQVGYLPEQPYFHKFLSPREALSLHAALLGLGRRERKQQIDNALAAVGLLERQQVRISKLSKGLMQRVGIGQALLGDPRLLILDEPTSGLDPIGRREMKSLITSLKAAGRTIFLSSHLLSEVEAVCDQVAILSRGVLVCSGSPDEIKRSGDNLTVRCAGISNAALEELSSIGIEVGAESAEDEGGRRERTLLRVASGQVFNALRVLEAHDAQLLSVTPEQETLEDAFMRLAA
ncbi:MAG: ABC transporter ATP-binding protein [Armatimonadota bacterium]|nr:ABC transporter ATP-binding protein [Armatimonadota bacterium]